MIAILFHIFLWMITTLAMNKILTKTWTQTHEMLAAPFLSSPPLPNDHFIHAKVLRQLSEDRMQEVVRSVVAKKFANLKALEDFMSRQ
jgi:hypothetical protein